MHDINGSGKSGVEPERSRNPLGYQHPNYAYSFRSYGNLIQLTESRAWIISRTVPGSPLRDLMGCYPFICCRSWDSLLNDIEDIRENFIALSFVTDPFADLCPSKLSPMFPDCFHEFKRHYVSDLTNGDDVAVCSAHRRKARRALRTLTCDVCLDPVTKLDHWKPLYRSLMARHSIANSGVYSEETVAAQFDVPGAVLFTAEHQNELVSMVLWYHQNDVAYYHLGASNLQGYKLNASFGLFWLAREYFRDRAEWLSFGSNAGTEHSEDGLTRFKEGWSSSTKPVYLCGSILNPQAYRALVPNERVAYFPAYRLGEFGT